MGLPHVLVRFYTNPDGRAARRTTLVVLCLLGGFYLLPTIYGALARVYTPDLLLTGRTDTAVLLLPERLVGGTAGQLLTALVTAGAFAAFLSTSSGLTVSVAGVLSQDVLRGSVRDFRLAAALAVSVPFLLSFGASSLAVADVVGLAFAVAASSFCPLLLLGIWWRGLTDVGADRRAAHRRRAGHRSRCRRPSPASTAAAGPAPCSRSRPRGPCRSRSP